MTVTTVEISRSELSSVNCHARHGFRGGAARARTRYFRPWQSANLIYDPAVTLRERNFYRDIEFFLFLFPFSFRITRIRYYFHPKISLNYFNWCLSCTITKIKQNLANKNLQTFYDIHLFFSVEINLKLGRSNFYNSIVIFLYCVITSCLCCFEHRKFRLYWYRGMNLSPHSSQIFFFLFIFNLDIKVYSKSR